MILWKTYLMRLIFSASRLYNLLKNNKLTMVYLPLGLYWVVLLALTSFPSSALPTIAISDKIKHFVAFAVLSGLLGLTLHFQGKKKKLAEKFGTITIVIVAIYGMLDEIHQYFIPGRYCEFWDFVADVLGGILGIVIIKRVIKLGSGKEGLE